MKLPMPYILIAVGIILLGAGIYYYRAALPGSGEPSTPMTRAAARSLIEAYALSVRETDAVKGLESEQGDFQRVVGAAEFRYATREETLSVFGLVVRDASLFLKQTEFFDEVKRASDREPTTRGEGRFSILEKPHKSATAQLTLRKDFTNGNISQQQFNAEVGWLMQWATYWRTKRYHEVSSKSEEELITDAPAVEAWAKTVTRPW